MTDRMHRHVPTGLLIAAIWAIAGCDAAPQDAAPADHSVEAIARPAVALPTPTATPTVPAAMDAALRSCATEIGAAAAARRVDICRNVSPATRPPCNAANSCALIEDEIARSCALFDGEGAPMAGCRADPKGREAAADVVRRYYAALDAHDYATAWSQWGDDGRPGQTFAAFRAGFAHTRATRVKVGTMEPGDAGAGSVYQPVPVAVEATLDDGTRQRFRGTYVVRRVNDVDGSTAAQRRWHLDSARLMPVR